MGCVAAAATRYSRIAVIAALLPTLDPVTLLLEMVPLLLLYELSIQVARLFAPQVSEHAAVTRRA